jgi:hypothetical protein
MCDFFCDHPLPIYLLSFMAITQLIQNFFTAASWRWRIHTTGQGGILYWR